MCSSLGGRSKPSTIPHQTPHQLTKQRSTSSGTPKDKDTTKKSEIVKDKPLSIASLPSDLLQNIEKITSSHKSQLKDPQNQNQTILIILLLNVIHKNILDFKQYYPF